MTIRLPSGEQRLILERCMATVGTLSNAQHKNRKIGRAGSMRWAGRKPTVRGVAMNPVDHPHGGGRCCFRPHSLTSPLHCRPAHRSPAINGAWLGLGLFLAQMRLEHYRTGLQTATNGLRWFLSVVNEIILGCSTIYMMMVVCTRYRGKRKGRISQTPWGVPTKGYRTRHNVRTDGFIKISRHSSQQR